MEWPALYFTTQLPETGQVILNCTHNPFLVLLAYVVACATGFATLDITERIGHAEKAASQRLWRWVGAGCLAGGIWAMHFVSMLAFQAPIEIHYQLPVTLISLLFALTASWLAMHTLSHPHLTFWKTLRAAVWIGLGIATMHYVGMAAMRSYATAYYNPALFALSIVIAIGASLAALLISRHLCEGSGVVHQLLKYTASLVLGAGIVSMHFTGMAALNLVLPIDSPQPLPDDNTHLQLGLTVAVMTLLIIGSSISAALADKKLQHKESDLKRVNILLSQLDQARLSLQQVAHYDALTNLINRRGFNQIFAEKLLEKTNEGGMLAVMFLDIDHFKRINDSLGHDAGDELLKVLASHIKDSVRSHDDVVARFGGDEFCILIGLHDLEEARSMAQRIMLKMKEPIELSGRSMVMTTSIGISVFPQDGTTCEELLKNADLALYQSKGSGRNGLHFFSPHMKNRATLELQLEEELRYALRNDAGLILYYQPIYDLKSGQVTKLEALIRWQHPVHGLLAPDRFIAIAEANGLINELDNWVLHKACEDLGVLSRQGREELKIAVNCSPLNLAREELADEIENALRIAGVSPQRLELEVTENALMGNLANTLALLKQIRSLGVSLSIDDFGTGYSSLAYLKRLPLNTLKIDRSFIQDIPKAIQDMEIVHAIIIMAHTLHLQVVSEGVETPEQHDFLERQGCDLVQGHLLSRPVPLAELPAVLAEINQRKHSRSVSSLSLATVQLH
ncbi:MULTISPECIES: bifunctional diguanylate cyclase/phosphodiesterase [unclassified Pseudomonas]|uniref:putative bifunctional diguanylate cyclase/phosphodiesterase n=1 Tax=unclassified Pseudomonas TaxID=196821 RepID=UPI000C86D134|nr:MULTISPECIES: bifunctional diguanylate cyclase/phosphodiesterase [unclassified Pseudomonas]PMV86113.1 diguanylate phosphodiesterase [Pseudomonas sp. GW101-1A09]PMV89739.1 diguanylate phosphodiesterase [Pseudomonas sp. FW306-2-2C-B10A]PMV97453.1 diguanylate phosphodiesterase [Pseudomonas sp. GW460-C8]PMW01347.1 diguanylate phosphodiesterase [Pseudomonas sp. MPR-TSA4]PMW08515.1 diguanylate phosphodiesterase [Pseudomonas sp. FW306-2-1A-C05A]